MSAIHNACVSIGVKTWTKATIFVANEVFHVWLIILQQRSLFNKDLLQNKDILVNGLFTWLLTRHLKKAILEVYQSSSSEATERWDLIFKYANPSEDVSSEDEVDSVWQTYLAEVTDFAKKLNALPSGSLYRVVVDLADEVEGQPPPDVEGWSRTTLRSTNNLQKREFGEDIIKAGGKIHVGLPVQREATEFPKSVEGPLFLLAVAHVVLEDHDKAFVGKGYSVQAGISQYEFPVLQGEQIAPPVSKIAEPISFDVSLHASQNIELTTEWYQPLGYNPRDPAPQLIEFVFQMTAPGPSFLIIDFYHECHWFRTIRLEFSAIDK